MNDTTPCPCCSGLPFADCCGPLLSGAAKASGPEALMRSRYSAYTLQDMPYLARTLHPSQRGDYDEAGAEKWARESEWDDLEIIRVGADPANPNRGTVEFRARYRSNGNRLEHHELAEFRKTGDNWYFYDGKLVGPGQFKRDAPKVGRNDPCPCGSGKKYKKCCG